MTYTALTTHSQIDNMAQTAALEAKLRPTVENSPQTIGAYDPFLNMDNWDDREARYCINDLNLRAATPDQAAVRTHLLRQSGLKPGDSVLELGCGTGRLLSDLARAVGVAGHAIGLEPQRLLAEEAERCVAQQKLTAIARVICARAEAIPLPDSSIDACVAQTTLIHIQQHLRPRVFGEVRRLLKPGGVFVTVDQDIDTWVIDHTQRDVTRKIVQFSSDSGYADGWTGRHLRRLLKQNGFANVEVQCLTHSDTEGESHLFRMARRVARSAAAHGVVSEEECQKWLDELDQRAAEGDFFSSVCFFCCRGTKEQPTERA